MATPFPLLDSHLWITRNQPFSKAKVSFLPLTRSHFLVTHFGVGNFHFSLFLPLCGPLLGTEALFWPLLQLSGPLHAFPFSQRPSLWGHPLLRHIPSLATLPRHFRSWRPPSFLCVRALNLGYFIPVPLCAPFLSGRFTLLPLLTLSAFFKGTGLTRPGGNPGDLGGHNFPFPL